MKCTFVVRMANRKASKFIWLAAVCVAVVVQIVLINGTPVNNQLLSLPSEGTININALEYQVDVIARSIELVVDFFARFQ